MKGRGGGKNKKMGVEGIGRCFGRVYVYMGWDYGRHGAWQNAGREEKSCTITRPRKVLFYSIQTNTLLNQTPRSID